MFKDQFKSNTLPSDFIDTPNMDASIVHTPYEPTAMTSTFQP